MSDKFGTIKPLKQLELENFGETVGHAENAADGTALSVAEIKAREMAARDALKDRIEEGEEISWAERYRQINESGVPWRIAVYVAWASMPKTKRTPRTQEELATEYLGLTSDRQIATWRKKYPEIDTMIAALQADALYDARADVFDALVKMAMTPDYKARGDRKLFLEMTGDYVPTTKLEAAVRKFGLDDDEDLLNMSEEKLKAESERLEQESDEEEES